MKSQSMDSTGLRPWWQNRFWLVLPLLLVNTAVAPLLPAAYQPEAFSRNLPAGLEATENALRVLVSAVPLLMPLAFRGPRSPLFLYGTGLAVYLAAWSAVILAPGSPWSTSLPGFTAPAWTSLFWLAAIAWRSTLRFVPGYQPWMYLAAAVLFTAVHTLHAALVWFGTGGLTTLAS